MQERDYSLVGAPFYPTETGKQCLPCDALGFQGPEKNRPTECKRCETEGMIYSDLSDPFVCKCDEKNGWFTAGDICINKAIVDTGNFFCTTCAYSPYTAK